MLLRLRRSFNAVGTQSAVLAGFAMTSFAEIDLPHNAFYAQKARRPVEMHLCTTPQTPPASCVQACLHLFVTISICANLMCTASTTFVSVWGSGKALRGQVRTAPTRLCYDARAPPDPPAPRNRTGPWTRPSTG